MASRRCLLSAVITVVFATAAPCAATAFADGFPTRPIRIIEPYPAGGPSDVGTRLMVNYLSAKLGQPLVVENKPGAAAPGAIRPHRFCRHRPRLRLAR